LLPQRIGQLRENLTHFKHGGGAVHTTADMLGSC
jgi:hypothetical protein